MKILILLIVLCPLSAFASVLTASIEKFDKGIKKGEPDLIFLSDGRVGILPKRISIESLRRRLVRVGSAVKIKMDRFHKVISIEPTIENVKKYEIEPSKRMMSYEPTILPDLETVNTIFRRMNRRWQWSSQCYNRAHVWNYEEFQRTGLLSKKVFIFYTRRYIRDYRFKWWFHAIPTVLAQHEGTIVERYLDPMFARSPLPQKAWTDIFIKSRRTCPVITKYSQYRDNQETEHCYLHFGSMYYWQPRDLDNFERTGFEKMSFIKSDVDYAYWEAF